MKPKFPKCWKHRPAKKYNYCKNGYSGLFPKSLECCMVTYIALKVKFYVKTKLKKNRYQKR